MRPDEGRPRDRVDASQPDDRASFISEGAIELADGTGIEWTEATWNPVTGCSKVSPGCARCYAERIELRFHRSVKPWTQENAPENVVLHSERLDQPLRWRRPRMVFVNSMSDLFHEQVPCEFVSDVFRVMEVASHHTFQVLTKRPERALELWQNHRLGFTRWAPNVWIGVSIENARHTWRADVLREIPAVVRFISAEPLLGSLLSVDNTSIGSRDDHEMDARQGHEPVRLHALDRGRRAPLDLTGVDWLIVGGESGPNARPMLPEWALELRDACLAAGVAFFFKQWGGRTPKAGGRKLGGRTHDAFPVQAQPASTPHWGS